MQTVKSYAAKGSLRLHMFQMIGLPSKCVYRGFLRR